MREFTDKSGVTWTVSEAPDHSLSSHAHYREGHDSPRGWLEFCSEGSQRSLRLYPEQWLSLSNTQLEELCARAREGARRLPSERSVGQFANDQQQRFAYESGSPIRAAFGKLVNGLGNQKDFEENVRQLAREARSSGLPVERAIIAVKLSVGKGADLPSLFSARDDVHQYELLKQMIDWIIEEYFGNPASPGSEQSIRQE